VNSTDEVTQTRSAVYSVIDMGNMKVRVGYNEFSGMCVVMAAGASSNEPG